MNDELVLSVILPALHPSEDYLRCVHSIRAALAGRVTYEIISVVRAINEFAGLADEDLTFVQERSPGIYGAMNQGVEEAKGRYLYFVGQDDILLPAAARALIQGKAAEAGIIVADVFWGERSIFKNIPSRKVLVWRNWCHQGLFYERIKFMDVVGEYPVRFKVQADHYANIVFGSSRDLKIFKYEGCIAWYSSDGFSSRSIDTEFREAFPELVRRHFGAANYYIVVARRILLKLFRLVQK